MATKKRAKSTKHEGVMITFLVGLIVLLVLGASWYLWYFYSLR
jgi:uncharacterized membrane protein